MGLQTHFPHWLDAVLEEVNVAVRWKLARSAHVAVISPELLYLIKKRGRENMSVCMQVLGRLVCVCMH